MSNHIFNFWHSGTLALSRERQSARMSEIFQKTCRLVLDGTVHFKCNYLTSLHFKGLTLALSLLLVYVVSFVFCQNYIKARPSCSSCSFVVVAAAVFFFSILVLLFCSFSLFFRLRLLPSINVCCTKVAEMFPIFVNIEDWNGFWTLIFHLNFKFLRVSSLLVLAAQKGWIRECG